MAEAQSTILIVDDDADDLAAVERALGSLGAEIVTLRDPHEVLPTVRGLTPDVVILDALLPGLSGFDLCKEIKTDADLKGTQVLIVTAVYLRQQYRHEALQQFKADAFLTKPFRPPELQRLVIQLLSRKSRRPQGRLLSRLGLPARPQKRSILGRLFGGGKGSEPDTRLTPPRPERRALAEEPSEGSGSGVAAEQAVPAVTEPDRADAASSQAIALPASLPDSAEPAEAEVHAEPAEAEAQAEPVDGVEASVPEASSEARDGEEGFVAAEGTGSLPEPPAEAESVAEPSAERIAETVSTGTTAAEPEPAPLPPTNEESAVVAEPSEPDAEVVEAESEEVERTDEVRDAVEAELANDATPVSTSTDTSPGEDDIEDAVASVESATSEADAAVEEDEPTAAESLETAPPEAASDVAWEAAEVTPPLEPAASTARFEPSKTMPAVELPESLKAGSPGESEPRAESERETKAQPFAEPVPEPRTAPPPAAEDAEDAEAASSDDSENPPVETRSRRRRRVGEAPLFDEEEFDAELRRELSKCRRVDRPLTLILIQVNDIDQIVELFGKEFREDVLWHVADQAMASLREVDVVGMISSKDRIAMTAFASDRYGGSRIVTRMRRTVGKHPIRVGEELPPIIPELAFGMASYPEDADDAEVLMVRAEEDLRAAKPHRED